MNDHAGDEHPGRNDRPSEDIRNGMTLPALWRAYMDNLICVQGRGVPEIATPNDRYMALAYTVRDRMMYRAAHAVHAYLERDFKMVCYFSAEFLLGPQLGKNLLNLGIYREVRDGLGSLGFDMEKLLDLEPEPGLGSGGLGRLAACYLDSLASLEIPSIGYGIRYEFGIFRQELIDGRQVERADKWLRFGNPWEFPRPEIAYDVKLGGRTESYTDEQGRYCVRWLPGRIVRGVAFDIPVLGYRVGTCNILRLWKAEATESFDLEAFTKGDYYRAVEGKVASENLTKVLYPSDDQLQGRKLRLEQQYFFVSCSLQDMIRIHLARGKTFDSFDSAYAAQLNDTHPALAVAELMRLLVDEHGMDWDESWRITVAVFAYTNHTLLPEALERWPLRFFKDLLPRHLEIILEINRRFLEELEAAAPDGRELMAKLSIIEDSGEPHIRMAHLACIGSHSVNGVAQLHTDLLKSTVMRDLYRLSPKKFTNITNGVSPRRWLALSNPALADLITEKIGDRWVNHLEELRRLESFADDPSFQEAWRRVKRANKEKLAREIRNTTGIEVDCDSLFDIQAKRIHEYKRQHLNVLNIIALYARLKRNPDLDVTPRSFIFGGKAAPGYETAKLIIRLITSVAAVLNNDPDIRGRIKVVFFPDFNVKNGQKIYPAADISEQISTAGKEASGTGNMKFALNGALTIGTLDGANIEIRQEVGPENFFLFGLTAAQVLEKKAEYKPFSIYHANPDLKEAIDLVRGGHFSTGPRNIFKPLMDALLETDEYMLLADFQSYLDCREAAGNVYRDTERWTRMSILNTAGMGKFSSDRAVGEYCRDIWGAEPMKVDIRRSVEWNLKDRIEAARTS